MTNKRYYWLKLNENFFEDDTIEWIEDQENGEKYLLFYLKLCLKSLKDGGNLIRYVGEMLMPYDIKALAKLTNTDKDTVAVALKCFEEIGLIERKETGELYMRQIDEMIGSETDSARRMRESRARKNALESGKKTLPSQSDNNVKECDSDVQKSDTEYRDKSIEIDIDKDYRDYKNNPGSFSKIFQAFEQNGFGTINITTKEMLTRLIEEYSEGWTLEAIETAVENNIRKLRYVEGILSNWKTEGKNTSPGGGKGGKHKSTDTGDSRQEGEKDWAKEAGIQSF